ncbi:uncharacterized protein LOC100678478 isoform X1 [Nasonia vitripennis]|uniref:CHK kinase-like domain-containing protein n=2 Tax=Nasonia vitripennis TaxID=7425 RepID=A0A7M7GGK2_NASVI|nr:uncharacterized protein LOC100678478 isoform X1 [Nasonia vitripennis]
MERRSVSEIIEQYQPLIRKYENDENLVILDAREEPGTKAGENYMSIVLRTKIIGRRGNGSPYKKSFMRKMLLCNMQLAKITRNSNLFRIESYFYEKLLPLLGPFGPDCILAQPREIIMEDLGDRDFSICERRKLLDLEHCSAVVQTLASMHASSLHLKLSSPDRFAELVAPLCENIFPTDTEESIGSFFESGVDFALKSLESIEPRTGRVERAIEFLRSYQDKVAESMRQLLRPRPEDEQRFWVITHGDTWNNNIMFLHDAEGKVVRVKFVDFQVARHSSPAFDFTYFLYSSARSEVLERDTDELIGTYERFLLHDLRRLDAPERDLGALARPGWFKDELRRNGLFGLFGALMVLQVIFIDEGRAVELEMNKTKDEFNTEKLYDLTPEKTERLFTVVDHYVRHFKNDASS